VSSRLQSYTSLALGPFYPRAPQRLPATSQRLNTLPLVTTSVLHPQAYQDQLTRVRICNQCAAGRRRTARYGSTLLVHAPSSPAQHTFQSLFTILTSRSTPVSDKLGFFDAKSTTASGMADPLASPRPHLEERKSFAPKQPVELAPPKDDPITYEQLKEADGMQEKDTSRIWKTRKTFRLTRARAQVPIPRSPCG
jgi:hypothetical protein